MRITKTRSSGRYRFLYLYIIVLAAIFITSFYLYKIKDYTGYYDNVLSDATKSSLEISRQSYIEAKKKEPVYFTLGSSQPVRAIVENYNLPSSLWTLVNKSRSIPASYTPNKLIVPDLPRAASISVRSDVVTPLTQMFTAAKQAGLSLMIASGYRSYENQQSIFNASAAEVGNSEANKLIALPGQSEHQTGLAVDIASSKNCYVQACFSDTAEGKWLATNSYKYGFILRYPSSSESITGYSYEPWHFRYVGVDLATAIYESNSTLETAWTPMTNALETLIKNGAVNI